MDHLGTHRIRSEDQDCEVWVILEDALHNRVVLNDGRRPATREFIGNFVFILPARHHKTSIEDPRAEAVEQAAERPGGDNNRGHRHDDQEDVREKTWAFLRLFFDDLLLGLTRSSQKGKTEKLEST